MKSKRFHIKDITDQSHWVELSNIAWSDAHAERMSRFARISKKENGRKQKSAKRILLKRLTRQTTAKGRNVWSVVTCAPSRRNQFAHGLEIKSPTTLLPFRDPLCANFTLEK